MNVNLSLNNSPDILVLFEANLDHMIDSSNFLMTDFFNRKNYVTHTPGLPAYVKEGLSYLQKTLMILICIFDWFYFNQCLNSFFSVDHHLCL